MAEPNKGNTFRATCKTYRTHPELHMHIPEEDIESLRIAILKWRFKKISKSLHNTQIRKGEIKRLPNRIQVSFGH